MLSKFILSSHNKKKLRESSYVIHTESPKFIGKLVICNRRVAYDLIIHKYWDEIPKEFNFRNLEKEAIEWYNNKGIHESGNPYDQIISKIKSMEFLKNASREFNVEEVKQIIKIIYPTKSENIFKGCTSNHIRLVLECISRKYALNPRKENKSCSESNIISAFESLGYQSTDCGKSKYLNITKKDVIRAKFLFCR